jgi:hypothetical protein
VQLRMFAANGLRHDVALDSALTYLLAHIPATSSRRTPMIGNRYNLLMRSGRYQKAQAVSQDLLAVLARDGFRSGPLLAALSDATSKATQLGDPAAAWRATQAALVRNPLDSMAPGDRPYLIVANLAALASQPADVKKMRSAWESVTRPEERDSVSLGMWDGAEAIARSDWSTAATALARAQTFGHCNPCGAYQLAYVLDRGGHADSAAAVYRAAVTSAYTDAADQVDDASWYAVSLKRLGEYYMAKGDKKNALDFLGRFTALWNEADPSLQPQVKDARAKIAELQKNGG